MILREVFDLLGAGLDHLGIGCAGLRVCELGDQLMEWDPHGTGKRYFESLGSTHVSIDLNGKNGSLPLDLTSQFDEATWGSKFDMVTNFGTTEHVRDQFSVFRNIHLFTKPGGVMIHTVPPVGAWTRHLHCHCWYRPGFFEALAEVNGYKVILERVTTVALSRGRSEPMLCAILERTGSPHADRAAFDEKVGPEMERKGLHS